MTQTSRREFLTLASAMTLAGLGSMSASKLSTAKEATLTSRVPVTDIYALKQGTHLMPTGSGNTEIHTLWARHDYDGFSLQTNTALEMTGEAAWAFGVALNGDVLCIKRGSTAQPTGSGTTEVHVLSAASRYQEFTLHTGTPLEMTGDTPWAFGVGPSDDLFCIKGGSAAHPTGSGTTEVHVLSAASSYQEFTLHTKTALEMTGDAPWAFAGFLPSVGFAFDNSWEFDNTEREKTRQILAGAVG